MSKSFRLPAVTLALPALSLFIATVVSLVAVPATLGRTWKSGDGAYSVDAEFVAIKDGKVSLRKADGTVIDVPVSRLSVEDQAYVAKQAAAGGALPAAKVAGPVPSRIRTFTQLVQASSRLRTASEVVRLYKLFLQDQTIAEGERKAAEKQLPVWEQRAKKDMVRVGSRWLSQSEAKDRKSQARQLVDEALRLIEIDQHEAATDKCVKASKLDEDEILADFVLGLSYALAQRDAEKSNRHFAECVSRDPQHISALNNLALTEVRLKRYSRALAHWQAALELAPASPEVIQNLGRLLALAKQGTVRVPSSTERRVSDLYAAAAVSAGNDKFNGRVGWLYLGYYAPRGRQSPNNEKPNRHAKQDSSRLIAVGWGTGFVVYPGYVLTNRHVVEGSAGLSVVPPGNDGSELPASVLAVAEDPDDGFDLAIIRCDGLAAPALPFIEGSLARRGTAVMVIGYPAIPLEGELKPVLRSTWGIINSLPVDDSGVYLLEVTTNHGNSGGPVCDAMGNVLGVHRGRVGIDLGLQQMNHAVCIPHSHCLPLLAKHIPGYRSPPANTKVKPWPDVDSAVSASTVLVWVKLLPSQIGVSPSEKKPGSPGSLEDPWCMTCNGRGVVDCPHCRHGSVSATRVDVVPNGPRLPPTIGRSTVQVPCKKCRGKGVLDCPNCSSGIDMGLR